MSYPESGQARARVGDAAEHVQHPLVHHDTIKWRSLAHWTAAADIIPVSMVLADT